MIALLLDWQAITMSTAWLLFGIWIGKDVVLFPFVYRAYEPGSEASKLPMRLLGSVAVTTAPISASGTGRVRLGAELWNARLASGAGSVVTDEEVRVTALEGLTLVVEPITSVSRPR